MALHELALTVVAAVAIVASIAVWAMVMSRAKRGETVVALEPRRPVPWGFFDLALVLAAYFVAMLVGRVLLRDVWHVDLPEDFRELTPEQLAPVQLGSMAATVTTVIFAVVLACIRTRATAADLGLSLRHWRYDLALGVLGFLALAAPVYALQAMLVHFFPTMHPLIDVLQERPDEWTFFVVGLSVSLVAPVAEEFFLRVLVQGWLERVVAEAAPGTFPGTPLANADEDPEAARGGRGNVRALRAIPIVVSALVFALLHVGHGPAPIPLFVLALGLGYLYQRTHRLWPPVVLHALLNTASLGMLWVQAG